MGKKSNAIYQAIYDSKYQTVVVFLNIVSVIILLVAIIMPIILISQMPSYVIERNPGAVILPIYFGFVLLIFSAVCYMISVILDWPSNITLWLQSTLNVFGAIIIIIGLIGLLIAVTQTSGTIREVANLGIIGGIILLVIHGLLGLLCIGTASIHEKFNADNPLLKRAIKKLQKEESETLFCSECGHEHTDKKAEFCEECGNKL
jgi:hypothetical protein